MSHTPSFRWVHIANDQRWELREVGHAGAFASVTSIGFGGFGERPRARKAGFLYSVHVRGLGVVALSRDPEAARAVGRELAASAMATLNSVAWEAGRPARERARREAEAAQAQARQEAAALEARKRNILMDALSQYVASTEEALAGEDPADLARHGITADKLALAQQMLDEVAIQIAREAA